MRRFHLIELEDQPWCPPSLRDAATDYLQFALHLSNAYGAILPQLQKTLQQSGESRIVDLASGSGGPWPRLLPALLKTQPELQVLLTDYYPNSAGFARLQAQFPSNLSSHREPVDARRVPTHVRGFRTMFTGFHHFQPADARAILADAVAQGQGIGIFEATRRDLPSLLAMLLSPLIVLLSSPFIRPFRLSRLFWTYLVPALPPLVAWDGIVSCLRTYTPQELRAMVTTIPGYERYNWLIGEERVARQAAPVAYLIGWPRREA